MRVDVGQVEREVGAQVGPRRTKGPAARENQRTGFDRANTGGRDAARPGSAGQLDRDINLDSDRAVDLDGITDP